MRTIKFRAWDKQVTSMLEVGTIDWITGTLTSLDEESYREPLEWYELMQYTGLKDKNGKEIYQGDIVLYKNWFQEDDKLRNTAVEWVGYYYHPFVQDYDGHYSINADEVEVVGNIYENPELLKN